MTEIHLVVMYIATYMDYTSFIICHKEGHIEYVLHVNMLYVHNHILTGHNFSLNDIM